LDAPVGFFEHILLSGRAIVLFDGLNELLDTSYRQEIAAEVDTFCNLYPSVPLVVTSRKRGYEQAPLSDDRFATFRLSSLTASQSMEYVTKLFQLEDEITKDEAAARARIFLPKLIVLRN